MPEPCWPEDAIFTGETCCFCGDPEFIEVFEVWLEDRSFQISTCCEATHEAWTWEMQTWDRKTWESFFATAGIHVRQVLDDGLDLTLDYGLELCEISCSEAKAFIREHHRHNPPPVSWRWGHGLRNGPDLVAVAMVGRPVARMIDHHRVVEVNRLCVRPDLPAGLTWNACSMLYGAAAKKARRRGFELIITYTLESEPGTSLRAAGWEPVAHVKGRSWSRPSRSRRDNAATCSTDKIRWERELAA